MLGMAKARLWATVRLCCSLTRPSLLWPRRMMLKEQYIDQARVAVFGKVSLRRALSEQPCPCPRALPGPPPSPDRICSECLWSDAVRAMTLLKTRGWTPSDSSEGGPHLTSSCIKVSSYIMWKERGRSQSL